MTITVRITRELLPTFPKPLIALFTVPIVANCAGYPGMQMSSNACQPGTILRFAFFLIADLRDSIHEYETPDWAGFLTFHSSGWCEILFEDDNASVT